MHGFDPFLNSIVMEKIEAFIWIRRRVTDDGSILKNIPSGNEAGARGSFRNDPFDLREKFRRGMFVAVEGENPRLRRVLQAQISHGGKIFDRRSLHRVGA